MGYTAGNADDFRAFMIADELKICPDESICFPDSERSIIVNYPYSFRFFTHFSLLILIVVIIPLDLFLLSRVLFYH